MKKTALILIILALVFAFESIALSEASREMRGSDLFNKHCSGCHRDAAKISLDVDIADYIRYPNPPMPSFSTSTISDKEAQMIAEFIKLQVYYAGNK